MSFVPGEVGEAFSLDGATGSVRIPASPSLDVGAGSGLTIDAWVNPFYLQRSPLIEWSNGSSYPGLHLWTGVGDPGNIYSALVDSDGSQNIASFISRTR